MTDPVLPVPTDHDATATPYAAEPAKDSLMREPRQERGQRRVDEILDATEDLIVEVGVAAWSIQELARRSVASVGSIYHFFPTKEAIFDALRERFAAGAHGIVAGILNDPRDWASLDINDFVECLISPFTGWLERNPAQYELAKMSLANANCRRVPSSSTVIPDVLETVFIKRWPDLSPDELKLRANVCWAIGDGIISLMLHVPPEFRSRLSKELILVMRSYISECEGNRSSVQEPPVRSHPTG